MDRLLSALRSGRRRAPALAVAAILALAACGTSTAPTSTGGTGPMGVGIPPPFTGPPAAPGPAYFAACLPAVRAINASGGVMGRTLSCKQFDTRGDPADAIPATRAMIAGNSNLFMVIGCTSDEAASVVPILEQAHIPAFCQTGQPEFDKSSNQDFHSVGSRAPRDSA